MVQIINREPKCTRVVRTSESSVRQWNKLCKIGQRVTVTNDDGTEFESMTLSEAWMLSGHTAVIMVEGKSGAFMLSRVSPFLANGG